MGETSINLVEPPEEGRQDPRINLFAMATLCVDSRWSPIKIRNISQSGALVEGEVPVPSTKICLRRGSLTARGEVRWTSSGRGGLQFDEIVSVNEWLPMGKGQASQQKIDEFVQQIKGGNDTPKTVREIASSPVSRLELVHVQKLLQLLADDLADDAAILMKFGSKLQCLDLASQMLGKLASAHA